MPTKKTAAKTARAPSMKAQQDAYQAQDDLRTIQRAQEIQADPKRMGHAKAVATQQIAALTKVTKKGVK